ncbi:hypothetical protein K402DRAFT_372683 [Aulographum hederae CBS 113979]|uniref:F-box domain-containing protein n=1 Tax=Aulographum hederae CBS 113979 TaxID=1176131 RepID=A0A6G1H7I9_9PEZI|nr:hypothetical protein K402DRAFT_372683 [Aulographum hederae CBS 113979]
MQSEPSQSSHKASIKKTTPETQQPTSQHGQPSQHHPASSGPQPRGPVDLEDSTDPGESDEDASASTRQHVSDDTAQSSRLSNKTPSPVLDRISEYERAVFTRSERSGTSSSLRPENQPGDGSIASPIATVPNEILVHVFSRLPAADVASVALVSRRYHDIVTSSYPWLLAFARYFPGPEALKTPAEYLAKEPQQRENFRSEKRDFTRLTSLPSWRGEYVARSNNLRALARGKPLPPDPNAPASRPASRHNAAYNVYGSRIRAAVTHLDATFPRVGSGNRFRLIHGADDNGCASTSDPTSSRIYHNPPAELLSQAATHPFEQGAVNIGDIVAIPNVMDVSVLYGTLYGQGYPGGDVYFHAVDQQRGRFLDIPVGDPAPELGIPFIASPQACCSVWISKTHAIPSLTEGLIGMMSGSAAGIVTAYSFGRDQLNRRSRFARGGVVTARWVLSPSVPIVGIAVDESYSPQRFAQNRIWAVALNALGEVFYLTKFPTAPRIPSNRAGVHPDAVEDTVAWMTGRTVFWNLVETSRRSAIVNQYQSKDDEADGSYSPRSSWNGMCLGAPAIKSETREIESFLAKKPKDFWKTCTGWDMHRKFEVDFAGGDDRNMAGEAVVVFESGIKEGLAKGKESGKIPTIVRYTRTKYEERTRSPRIDSPLAENLSETTTEMGRAAPSSLFGGPVSPVGGALAPPRSRTNSSPERPQVVEEWRVSRFVIKGVLNMGITTTAIDRSTYATLTIAEDPAIGSRDDSILSRTSSPTSSATASPDASPMMTPTRTRASTAASGVPGQRARFVAAGTSTGSVFLWDVRAPTSQSADVINTVPAIRVIHTDSPKITCLGLTALYVVHGGEDGLVQAWDPLASTAAPVRTINSRNSRLFAPARRHLARLFGNATDASTVFAAGAVVLDPDASILRGAVALSSHMLYWSYDSATMDIKRGKARKSGRRSVRGSNGGSGAAGMVTGGLGKGMRNYIADEVVQLGISDEEDARRRKRLEGRFGTGFGSEEEVLRLAELMSLEEAKRDEERRMSSSAVTSDASTPEEHYANVERGGLSDSVATLRQDGEEDDMAKAIRLSLEEQERASPQPSGVVSGDEEMEEQDEELRLALQLSMAEEESRRDAAMGKGKGRA